jgi:dCMP deaminase
VKKKFVDIRPTWDEYFLNLVDAVGKRSTCDRGFAATLIVKDKRILTTGYSGAPSKLPDCNEIGHELSEVINDDGTTSKHCIRTVHSEQNAIIQAAKYGISIDGATVYTRYEPCYTCAKMIVNAGIKKVICQTMYHRAQRTREIFKSAGIELIIIDKKIMEYKDQK